MVDHYWVPYGDVGLRSDGQEVVMTQTLVGKIAPLVTGATRGIGRASAVARALS